jgi:hypothetical protein
MTTGTLKTQGTELFFVNEFSSSDSEVVKVACPTGITGLGGAADQLDDTCLDSTERTFKRGLGNPGAVNVPFNFIPTNLSHQDLLDMKEDGLNRDWMIGFSDGTADPTLVGEVLTAPASRTSARFNAYVADVTIDIATNEIVRGTLVLQRSGAVDWFFNAPAP